MARHYRYLCQDLMSGEMLADLPLIGATWNHKLNGVGSFSATLPLGDPRITALDPLGATRPARTAIYVEGDGILLWGGILWTRRYSSDHSSLELQAQDWLSYLSHRIIRPRLTDPGLFIEYLATDPIAIIQDLWTRMRELVGGDIGVDLVGSTSSDAVTDWGGKDVVNDIMLKPYSEALTELSSITHGFDYRAEATYDTSGRPLQRVRLGYPRLGASVADTGLVWEYPGSIMSYAWPEDGTRLINRLWMLGQTFGGKQLISEQPVDYTVAPTILAGWPLLEGHASNTDTQAQDTLATLAAAYLAAYNQGPLVLPSLTVDPDADPVLGTYSVGDECRLRIRDPFFPGGLDEYWRITEITVTPGETTHDTVVLTLGNVFVGGG